MRDLTDLRVAQGLSRRQLSLKAGLSGNAVSMAERRGSASVETLTKLAGVLGVRTEELMSRPPERHGREAFFASQQNAAVQALIALRGAEDAARNGHKTYTLRFLKLAKDAVQGIEEASRDAIRIERSQQKVGSDRDQASADPNEAPSSQAAQERSESLPTS